MDKAWRRGICVGMLAMAGLAAHAADAASTAEPSGPAMPSLFDLTGVTAPTNNNTATILPVGSPAPATPAPAPATPVAQPVVPAPVTPSALPAPAATSGGSNLAPAAPASSVPTGITNTPAPVFQPLSAGGGPNQPATNASPPLPGTPTHQFVDPASLGTVHDPAFRNMTGKIFPMSPEQIQALHGIQDVTQRAIAAASATPPRPVVSTQNVLLSPGAVPPIVRLGTGYVTSIVFIDQTGSPWPVAAYSIGDPSRFNIQWDQESNVMMMQGRGPYATGNMAVTLRDLPTPVMVTLVSDQRVVDYRLDLRVQGRGPKATGSMIAGTMPSNSNPVLMNLLDGVAPSDAKILSTEGAQAQAWLYDGHMLLRTPLTVLSPGWQATMTSPDGTKVYQLSPTPVVLVSDQGRTTALQIKGF